MQTINGKLIVEATPDLDIAVAKALSAFLVTLSVYFDSDQ